MGEAQEGEVYPQGGVGIKGGRGGLRFQMHYYDRLAKVFVHEGFNPARARDINTDPSFMDLYRVYPHNMMSLIQHIIRASRVLATMRNVGHAMTYT